MTIDDVRRKSLRGIKDVSAYTANYDFSDCVYDAIQEMQTNSLCSRVEIRKKIGINGELGSVNIINGGSGFQYPPVLTVTDNIRTTAIKLETSPTDFCTTTLFSVGTVHTVSFEFKPINVTKTQHFILGENAADGAGITIEYSTGTTTIRYRYHNGVSATYVNSSVIDDLDANTTYRIDVTRNGTAVEFFLNSVSVGTATMVSNPNLEIDGIGRGISAVTAQGYISRLRIANKVLSADEIERQYNNGYGNAPLQGVTYLARWEFDGTGGSSTTETDLSGNGRTAILSGAASRESVASGESSSTIKAVLEASIENGSVTDVDISGAGLGYFSQPTITFSGGVGSGFLATAEIQSTVFNKVVSAKFSSSSASEIPIECLYVDAMFKVDTDGTKIPIKLVDRYSVSAERDTGVSSNTEDLHGAVEWNRGNIEIFTPWDMTDCTLEMWIRFQIPYVQDANVGTNANSYIDTIPVQFQNRLISGVKYHIYEAMEELSGFSGKYQPMMKVFGEQWFRRDLPYVKQEVNGTKAAETVHYVKPATVAGLE